MAVPGPPFVITYTKSKLRNTYRMISTVRTVSVGRRMGSTMWRLRRQNPAPSMRAASTTSTGSESIPPWMTRIENGRLAHAATRLTDISA